MKFEFTPWGDEQIKSSFQASIGTMGTALLNFDEIETLEYLDDEVEDPFKIYLFATEEFINIPGNTVGQVKDIIAIILKQLKGNPLYVEKVNYPENPDAYELRILDREDSYEPDMFMASFGATKVIERLSEFSALC